jgi:hypothetical protein
MPPQNPKIEPPTVSFRISDVNVEIDTGELLFPTIVLLFCIAYYADTRGLPARSMMYAEPLLYTTAVLAVVTIVGQAVSVKQGARGHQHGNRFGGFIGWQSIGGERSPEEGQPKDFGVSSAVGVGVLLIGYLLSLYVVPFVVGTAGFLGGSLYVFGERSLMKIVIYSVGFTVLTWAVFVEWLFVPLP